MDKINRKINLDMMVHNLLPSRLCDRKLRFAIGCINVSVGAHALGKDVAYNADERVGPHAPHSSLLIL